jgi:hypothetical protein
MELGKLPRNGDEGNNSASQTPIGSGASKGKLDFTDNQSKSRELLFTQARK